LQAARGAERGDLLRGLLEAVRQRDHSTRPRVELDVEKRQEDLHDASVRERPAVRLARVPVPCEAEH